MSTDHGPLISLYSRARAFKGVTRITSVRDCATIWPCVRRNTSRIGHPQSALLKIAPEHTEEGVLSKMMKPGIGTYDRFKQLFDRFSREAGKEQYLIPYFIAAHPGTEDEDMLNLALWLKRNNFRLDQVQTFCPRRWRWRRRCTRTERLTGEETARAGGELVGSRPL
jgi:radical SAM superfamily enzyme YgiQ (UPF0313 family)